MRRLLPASRSWYALVVSAALAACGGDGPTEPGGGGGGGGGANTPAAVARANDNTNGQSAAVGTAVANAPAVRVTNAAGAAVANVTVTFAVTAGGGTLGAASATTNAQGIASAGSWTLGAAPGTNTVTATVSGLTPVTFTATGTAAPAAVALVASRVDVGGVAVKCVVRASGVVSCWGENPEGNLGDGTQTFRQFPVNLAINGVTFASTSLGSNHGCALTAAGAAYCWGRNDGGMVGDGSTTNRLAPVAVSGNHTFKALAAGPTYTCGIKSDDTLWCWGTQNGGAVATQGSLVPKQLAGGSSIVALSVTLDQVCGAVGTGGVKCWSGNIFAAGAPAVVSASITFKALAGGNRHHCGLAADGRAYCWGANAVGQLGTDDINDRAEPTLVTGGRAFTSIDAGALHSCGLTAGGEAYCWGANTSGQVGNGVVPSAMGPGGAFDTPQRVVAPAGVQFAQIGAGGFASCAVASGSGQVYCWGARTTSNSTQVVDGLVTPTEVRDQ